PILFEAGQVDDAKIGTARRHPDFPQLLQLFLQARFFRRVGEIEEVAGVTVVGGGLAEVIEPRPDELARAEGVLILAAEFGVRSSSPRGRIEIVGAHLKISLALVLIVADWKEVLAPGTHA